jgi:prepilin-type N-terminal cleavage/methylation domain-containing protein
MMPNRFQLENCTKNSVRYTGLERGSENSQRGFTLFELLGVVMIFGVLTFISVNLYNSFKSRSQLSETQDRLKLISSKIKQYYRAHEQLPAAAGAGANEVPVQFAALDMEQKYRLDGWGQYFNYEVPDPNSLTTIRRDDGTVTSIRSRGPDQALGTVDDFTELVDVTAEAKEITRGKLKVLQEKVAAYDALFAGIDNDGSGGVDESAGAAAVLRTGSLNPNNTCPPTNSFTNDPSEGYSTLDAIESGAGAASYNCQLPLIGHILTLYHLPGDPADINSVRGDYGKDAWGHRFIWGYLGQTLDDGTTITTALNPRYHRFYSSGPSTTIVEDDIIFTGE